VAIDDVDWKDGRLMLAPRKPSSARRASPAW